MSISGCTSIDPADTGFRSSSPFGPAGYQAVDRACRIGRIKKIIAYRLITAGTIEEKILRLKEHKRNLADTLIRADEGGLGGLSEEEVRALFSR